MKRWSVLPALPFRSLRHFLTAWVLVVVLPGLLFGLLLVGWATRQLAEGREQEAQRLASAAAEAMGAHVRTMMGFTAVLSRIPLEKDNYPSFYRMAKSFADDVGYHVTLADAGGHQFLSTRLPFGTVPPQRLILDSVKKAAASGRPAVSDLFMGRMARRHVITVDTPVSTREGLRIITLSCDSLVMANVLYRTIAPEGWILGLIDGQGNLIARSKDPDKWVGQQARPELVEAVRNSERGAIYNTSLEGMQLFNVFQRVPGTRWTVVVGVPETILYAPLLWPVSLLVGALAMVIGLTALLAYFFSRQFNLAAGKLIEVARNPLRVDETEVLPNSFAEFEEVAQVLKSVAAKRYGLAMALDLSASIIRDMDGTIRHWTTGCQQLYGWTAEEALGRLTHELLKTEFPRPLAEIEIRLRRDGKWVGELSHTGKNGKAVRISAHWTMHTMEDSQAPVIVETLHDISAETRLEHALREREAHFRATFEQAGVGVCHADLQGRFLRVNKKYCRILGYSAEELLRMRFQDIIYSDDRRKNIDGSRELLSGAIQNYSAEKRYVRQDGSLVWVNVTMVLVRKPAGEADYFLAIIEDIQKRKEVEEQLAEERETRHTILAQQVAERTAELEAANRQLEGFLYAASHDLKGPLGRISSFSTLLEKQYADRLEGDGLLFLNFIRDNALRLSKLIDDLLTHARIDQQSADLQSIDLQGFIRVALLEKRSDLQASGTQVTLDVPNIQVLGDSYALSQVLHNLIENALKYSSRTRQPTLEIGGRIMESHFQLRIRDNGIGFDMEYHDKIFEIFRRLHTYAEYAGSGVGLALVKRAMQHMGGRVWAESTPGQGSTFYVEFKLAQPAKALLPELLTQ